MWMLTGSLSANERRALTRATCVAGLLILLAGSSGFGQEDWAKKMFDHTSHDFGTVARGAKVEHAFTVENKYEEDMYITEVRTSCGCTATKISKRRLKTWEKSQIVAHLDTRGFYGRKDATLTVVFGGEFPAQVQLHVHAYIRSDVVVQPGSVQFGTVAEGSGAVRKVTVSYAGRPDWQILKVETKDPHLEARAVKLAASPLGQVTYELVVKLKPDAPAGYLREFLILVTNDRRAKASHVPLAVEGVVVSGSAVTVRPSPLLMGVVGTGQSVTRQLVVQGKKPFRIEGVECSDQRLTCPVPEEEKTLHLLRVTLKAGEEAGKLSAKIRIRTSLGSGKPLEVPVSASIIGPGSAGS